jgi:hypothetical protein
MNKNKYLALSVTLLLLLGISYSYYVFKKPIKVTEIKDSPFSILLQNASTTFVEETDWYEAKIGYPINNDKVKTDVFNKWYDFAKETQIKEYNDLTSAKEGLQINVDGLKYSFFAEYRITTSTDTISYIYQIYNFTGGAHGSTAVYAITENKDQQIVPIETILPTDKLGKVAKIAEADLKKQKADRLRSFGTSEADVAAIMKNDSFLAEGVKPTRENYSVAWYDGDDVVISFGQYQVASYAEGMFEVRIPRKDI